MQPLSLRLGQKEDCTFFSGSKQSKVFYGVTQNSNEKCVVKFKMRGFRIPN